MRKAAVIGYPVAHSLSPRLHQYWLKQYDIDGSYEAVEVAPATLAAFVGALVKEGYVGVNVTVPHKRSILPMLSEIDDAAAAIGAVNTVVTEGDTTIGRNTDAYGFIENLKQQGFPSAKNRAVVLGAGGAARAVVKALADEKFAHIVIVNRTAAKAQEIASNANTSVEIAGWDARNTVLAGADLLVNATSLGMDAEAQLDMDLELLPKTATVADIVYTPLETPLIAAAGMRGNLTVDGLGMLIHQAVPAFEAFFGRKPEVDENVRRHLLEKPE